MIKNTGIQYCCYPNKYTISLSADVQVSGTDPECPHLGEIKCTISYLLAALLITCLSRSFDDNAASL